MLNEERVVTDQRATRFVIGAAVKPTFPPVIILPDDRHWAATMRAASHAGEEVFRIDIAQSRCTMALCSGQSSLNGSPQIERDDAQIRGIKPDPVLFIAAPTLFRPS